MKKAQQTLVLLLAGGVGSRLNILVQSRAKPAVPFGGIYRIIDFSLSNVTNSGLKKVGVLTQYKPLSLMDHLGSGSAWLLGWGAIVQWLLDHGIHHTHIVSLYSWIQGGSLRILDGSTADINIAASFQLDAASAVGAGPDVGPDAGRDLAPAGQLPQRTQVGAGHGVSLWDASRRARMSRPRSARILAADTEISRAWATSA